jgi:SAM-dependent methyltransferase
MRHTTVAELRLGIEGLALLRGLIAGSDEDAAARLREVRRLGAAGEPWMLERTAYPERSVTEGYAEWSATYEARGNPLIHLEETVLLPLLAAQPTGRALDAACGTGRIAARLAAAGHDVLGVDASPEMLAVARELVSRAEFVEGRLESLPVEGERFDLVVCALALDHLPALDAAVAELARAAGRGGRVVITDVHPFMVQLGGHAAYAGAAGAWAFVRAHPHLHRDYLRAFRAARLEVDELLEPPPDRRWFELQSAAWTHAPDAFRQAFEGMPAAIVWSLIKR